MRLEKILFHTKFRELAFNALESVLELKKSGLKEVILVYVVPREEVSFVPYGGYLKEEEERLKEVARIRFEDWQKAIAKKGLESKVRIEIGVENSRILSVAKEEKVDMIVTGKKKRTTMEKVYIGSHILDLLRQSPVPILMVKYMVQFKLEDERLTRVNDHIYDRPLLATDWSKPSENGLNMLLAFKGISEKIMITHIIGSKLSKGTENSVLKTLEEESKNRLNGYCQTLEKSGMKTESHLAIGKTAPEILKVARENNATMIVMGRTGKDWIQEFWWGGVSHKVAEISELPVLLVP